MRSYLVFELLQAMGGMVVATGRAAVRNAAERERRRREAVASALRKADGDQACPRAVCPGLNPGGAKYCRRCGVALG